MSEIEIHEVAKSLVRIFKMNIYCNSYQKKTGNTEGKRDVIYILEWI